MKEHYKTYKQRRKNNKQTQSDLIKINEEARKQGMSYGQYVAFMEGKIKHE